MRRTLLAIPVPFGILTSDQAWAHHSFPARYLENESITLEGDIVTFDYANPHTWVTFNVPDSNGKPILWAAEWSAPARLKREGVQDNSFRPGDHVIISGSPGKVASEHHLHLKAITRPSDGSRKAVTRRDGNSFQLTANSCQPSAVSRQ